MTPAVAAACSPERLRSWNRADPDPEGTCVVYWMAHAQRASHNLAFDTAIETAKERDLPLLVLFDVWPAPPEDDLRHVRHMLTAFPELAAGVIARGAAFAVRGHDSPGELPDALTRMTPAVVVTDEDAMPHARAARAAVGAALRVPLVSVDADVLLPTKLLDKREHAARTLRPKMHRMLEGYAGELGASRTRVGAALPASFGPGPGVELWRTSDTLPDAAWVERAVDAARAAGVPDVAGRIDRPSGMAAARRRLHQFVERQLDGYDEARNQPEVDATSELSIFLHHGHVSPHEVLAAVRESGAPRHDIDAFVEQFTVRRELAWNYVQRTDDCRSYESLPEWARLTLEAHAGDPRPELHTEAEMRAAQTRDPLWNAAQLQMLKTGTMHNYLRMYWAKQILTWTSHPREAFDIALRLHDTYAMDARDPNSVVGVSWAIGGVHDRGWPEREIFGKVRSMTFASTGRKFDSKAYMRRFGDEPGQLTLG